METKRRVRVVQQDIIESLKQAVAVLPRPGTAYSDINVVGQPVTLPLAVVERAIAEIERLRRLAGAVSDGESFLDMRKASRMPPQAVEKPSDME